MAMDLTGVDLAAGTIRTERLLLRPPTERDVDAITRACQDPYNQRWLSLLPSPYTREDAVAFVHGIAARGHADGTDVANVPSQVVARRAGFVEEGRMRSALPYRDGRFGDALLFSRLPGDPAPG